MTEQASVQSWIDGAERMLKAAKNSLGSGDFEITLFSCHLAVEKMLKAKYIATHHEEPPMTHKLVDLCSIIGITLSQEQQDQLNELTSFSSFARYGDESWLQAETTKENCAQWIQSSSEFL